MTLIVPSRSVASCGVTSRLLKAVSHSSVPYAGCYRCNFSFVFHEYEVSVSQAGFVEVTCVCSYEVECNTEEFYCGNL
jgi:hypothetical protein